MNGLRHLRSRRVLGDSAASLGPADIVISGGCIERLAEYGSLEAAAPDVVVEDFGDAVVMPALIDVHVHVNEPGRADWEGFDSATRAAAAGGIAALFDMPLNSHPVTVSPEAFAAKCQAAQGICRVDVGLYGGLVPSASASEIEPLLDTGVWALKAFLCDSGLDDFGAVGREQLAATMPLLAGAGLGLLAHAEITDGRSFEAGGYSAFLASRPASFELEAIELLIELCRVTGCAVHVVHLATAAALPILRTARAEGLPITVETCPHYLTFCSQEIGEADTRFKCTPPIRDAGNREGLWGGLADGTIDLVASDHSPCPPELKALARGDFAAAWGGISSLQLLLPSTWTAASERGFAVQDVARWLCRAPARRYALDHERGSIAPGWSADLVIWHPERRFVVEGRRLQHRHPVTAYEGRRLRGVVERTILRGADVFVDRGSTDGPVFPGAAAGRVLLRPAPLAAESLAAVPLDAGPVSELEARLASCCASRRWLASMLDRLPFDDLPELLAAAEDAFDELAEADWLEAFAGHPRIGDLETAQSSPFAASEQAGSADAPAQIAAALQAGNRLYEQRFGFVYLVFASGKSAGEMLDILQRRLDSTREQELLAAAVEQRKITRGRLRTILQVTSETET